MDVNSRNKGIKPKMILFDVNGTLLDLNDVKKKVNKMLDSKRGFSFWMEMFLHYSLVDNCTGPYHRFTDIAKATTAMASRAFGVNADDDNLEEILETMKHLPLHEGVQKGLSLLHDEGYRLAVLTNLPADIVGERMERTGLISYFEKLISAEEIKRYKPSLEAYQWAAQKLETAVEEVLMVTAHGWDICGAAHAGMQTAFIERSDQPVYPLAPAPFYKIKTVTELAKTLSAPQLIS